MLFDGHEDLIGPIRFVKINLGDDFHWGVHIEDGDARIDDVHVVIAKDIGDGSASPGIDFAELGELEVDVIGIEIGPDLSDIFRIGIVASGLARATRIFI